MERTDSQSAGPGLRQWVLAALLVLAVALSAVTSVDRYAAREYESLFQRALVSFALARTLNGVISAVQGTELALQPAGVGVTLTPGQVLDPVNDLVERFSWIMLGATISLGIQQVMLDVGQWWGVRLLVAGIGLLWLWSRFRSRGPEKPGRAGFDRTLTRLLIVVLFIRFAVPVAIIANEALYRLFLESRYVESAQVIEVAGSEIEDASQAETDSENAGEEGGLFDALARSFDSTRDSLDMSGRLDYIKERATDLVEHLIQLSVVFILQTGILPIAFLWIFLQLFRRLLQNNY
jgi:hypothetical protein